MPDSAGPTFDGDDVLPDLVLQVRLVDPLQQLVDGVDVRVDGLEPVDLGADGGRVGLVLLVVHAWTGGSGRPGGGAPRRPGSRLLGPHQQLYEVRSFCSAGRPLHPRRFESERGFRRLLSGAGGRPAPQLRCGDRCGQVPLPHVLPAPAGLEGLFLASVRTTRVSVRDHGSCLAAAAGLVVSRLS